MLTRVKINSPGGYNSAKDVHNKQKSRHWNANARARAEADHDES